MIDTSIKKPKLLLHTCCAPCFTTAFDVLKQDYDVTIYWFNPNIYPVVEHDKRLDELIRYSKVVNVPIIIESQTEAIVSKWNNSVSTVPDQSEGGPRCDKCITFRLDRTAEFAKNNKFDYFATTLSVSPHKNAPMINASGHTLMMKYYVKYLEADFKKNDGYLKSIRTCKEYNIYRQDYCGCEKSKGSA